MAHRNHCFKFFLVDVTIEEVVETPKVPLGLVVAPDHFLQVLAGSNPTAFAHGLFNYLPPKLKKDIYTWI